MGRGVEAITGVGTISTDAASDPDILPSPMAGFMVVVTQGFMVVAAMEGGIGKGGSWTFVRTRFSIQLELGGAGEIGVTGIPAAIANAVYNATGQRVRDFPITLDKLLVPTHGLEPNSPLYAANGWF